MCNMHATIRNLGQQRFVAASAGGWTDGLTHFLAGLVNVGLIRIDDLLHHIVTEYDVIRSVM